MTWPFDKLANAEVGETSSKPDAPPEKSAAELIADALRPLSDGLTNINKRLDGIEQTAVRRPTPEERPDPVQPTSVLDNEDVAFAQRLTPIMLRQLEVEARIVRTDIKAEYAAAGYGELWSQFEADINQTIDTSPLVTSDGKPLRGDPQYIRNVVDMVFGRAARKAGMRFDGKKNGFFLESGTGSDAPNAAPVNDGLTEAQRRVMARMHISPDEAKKVMSKLQFIT